MKKIHDQQLLEHWIDLYGNLIFSICFQITRDYFEAEDLAQETFLSAYQKRMDFDGKNEKAWLTKIATNKCLDYKKSKQAKLVTTEEVYFLKLPSTEKTPEHFIEEKEIRERLLNNCRKLKAPYNSIAEDYFIKNLSPDEIAIKRNKNKKTVQTQIYRAKAMLRRLWKEEVI